MTGAVKHFYLTQVTNCAFESATERESRIERFTLKWEPASLRVDDHVFALTGILREWAR